MFGDLSVAGDPAVMRPMEPNYASRPSATSTLPRFEHSNDSDVS
jgi:hypothetical protein